jgi:glycosyltransferase involved in cell wall biosynthesis
VKEAIPRPFPYSYAARVLQFALKQKFKSALAAADPSNTIAYFWPAPPKSLVQYARQRGILTVREMINTCAGTVKAILEEAYDRLGLTPPRNKEITKEQVENEREELGLYDYILSPNPGVEESLVKTGLDRRKILRSSYGWSPTKFASSVGDESRTGFRALFIGGDTVRKGLPQLLAAWQKSGVVGELLVVGEVDNSLRVLLAPYLRRPDIQLFRFQHDLGPLYKSADVFLFPSLEEGDPQVTYEAAGCGLPVITTPMGSANIIKDGINGLVVQPYNVDALAEAIFRLANSPDLRRRMGMQAASDALRFTYSEIGRQRAKMLSNLIATEIENGQHVSSSRSF